MAAASDELVRVLLGLRWMKAAALAPWIALGAAFAVTGHLLAIMNEAVGRLGAKFVIQGFTTLAMVIAFVAAVRMGLVYCAMAYGVGGAVFLLGQVWLSGTVLEMKPISILRWCWPGMLAGGIEYGVVRCVRLLLITHSPVTRLVAEIAACAATLVLFYRAAFPGLFGQMLRMSGLGRWADGPATYQQ